MCLADALRLYLVTAPGDVCALGLTDTVDAAIAGGVTLVQYRTSLSHKGAAYREALALRDLTARRGVPFLVNDHADLALAVGADGVHLGQRDLPPQAARRIMGAGKWLGLSTNNAAHIAAVDAAIVDYIGIGPIFATTGKADPAPVVGVENLARWLPAAPVPVVAIGGISVANFAAVRACGVAGIAVISAICRAASPFEAARALCA